MKAINNYVVVQNFKKETKHHSGLILTEELDYDNTFVRAKVISVGNMVEGLNKEDVIHYNGNAGHNLPWEGNLYRVIKNLDVVLVE
tara:strand:- start:478 stop:735 length:258 start_codon:yes stop_codon:yes gene_type:complete